ncbi:hypothetical protein Alches_14250 [Alicyclobacillus hesperidum subsp. aegles]|nr:hypothetical protein Alches_14250 [Alicyclobacillus hesperidum subsp. aegles]
MRETNAEIWILGHWQRYHRNDFGRWRRYGIGRYDGFQYGGYKRN